MKREQIAKIKAIITDIVMSECTCHDCYYFDVWDDKKCSKCELKSNFKQNMSTKDYINEYVNKIKNALK